MKIKESVMVAAAAAFALAISAKAQPVGTMISPGIFIRASGVFLKPNFIFFRPSGIRFNPFIFGGARPFGPETVGRPFPEAFGHEFFPGERGFREFGEGGGFNGGFGRFGGGGFGHGFNNGNGQFGFGIDEAIRQERGFRQARAIQQERAIISTTAIGPQSGGPAIAPINLSPHIERQQSPRMAVGGSSPHISTGRGVGHGGGGGHR